VPFLAETGGYAPDLPGFGGSSKRGDGDFTLDGYARFVGALVEALGLERVRLVVHDWGAAALAWAAANPERIERLVVIDAVPLLAGYRWHRMARLWRTRGVGELVIGTTTAFALRRLLPPGVGSVAAEGWDQGTQRAILRLYRSAPSEVLASHEQALGALASVPTLVVWGKEDPYIATTFATRYADALGGATVRDLSGAGHWPWIDDDAARGDVVSCLR
jgi:pimeloyl-ACP methyl ester carboxylesterase